MTDTATGATGGAAGTAQVPPPPAGGNGPADAATSQTARTFTQAEVDAIAAREKDQGRRSAAQQLADELGVSLEDAKEIIKGHKAQQDAQLSEAQKAQQAADRAKAEAEREKQAAAKERFEARVERALLRAGVPAPDPKNDPEGKTLARVMRMVNLEHSADDAAINAEVETLKKDLPSLFAATSSGIPPSDPPGTPPRQQQNGDAFQRGAQRAQAETQRRDYNLPGIGPGTWVESGRGTPGVPA